MDELPKNKADPPIRLTLHAIGLSSQVFITIYELFLALERIVSAIKPAKYYSRRLAKKVNFYAKYYCSRRFEELHGKTTLNARYQVKEAAELATSLQTVYFFSLTLKSQRRNLQTLTAVSIFLIGGLIHTHPRLRRKFEILRQRFRGIPITIASHSDVFAIQERTGEGDVYFDKLAQSWNQPV
ncbi:hypothetical protein PENTCL1PPCAC_16682, partial [Pristionchus entomophagus]